MIPYHLEKLILSGKATFKTFNHAFGAYGSINLPKNNIGIITKIVWYPFLNPLNKDVLTLTWEKLIASNEYKLKIYSQKTTNHYHFKNGFRWSRDPGISIQANVSATIDKSPIWNDPPIITDCYLIHTERINFSVTRSINSWECIPPAFGILNSKANEKPKPNGFGYDGVTGLDVLKSLTINPAGNPTQYQPPSSPNTDIPTNANYVSEYDQLIQSDTVNEWGSLLSNPDNGEMDFFAKKAPFLTHPLIIFDYVIVHEDDIAHYLTNS